MSYVCVAYFPIPIGVVEYVVCSSDSFGAKLPDGSWSPSIRSTVISTRRNGGATKGRVLYLLEGRNRVPVAALAYHIESTKELHIRGAESALEVKEREREFIGVLLLCADGILRKMPGRQGAARIVWDVPAGQANEIRAAYGFSPAPGAKPAGGHVALARRVRGS